MSAAESNFLIFEIQGIRYAFDLAQIAEVADPSLSWPIPMAPACISGAVHIHGTIIAMVDLAFFLGLPPCRNPERIIILHQNIAAMAFVVNKVIQIVPMRGLEIHNSSQSGFAPSVIVLPEGKVNLLDMDAIVKAVENMMI